MALAEFGITRLAARVASLRTKGHMIVTEMRVADSGAEYAAYSLVKEPCFKHNAPTYVYNTDAAFA